MQTCRGSHTHTLVIDPKDKENVYLYISGSAGVRPAEELAGCSGADPDKDPDTALFTIVIIKVPVAHPELAKVVASPRIFTDPAEREHERALEGRQPRRRNADDVDDQRLPRHHRPFGSRVGRRRVFGQWDSAGHIQSGESCAY